MSEKTSPVQADTAAADHVVPRHSSLFVRQAAFVATLILLTGGGLTVASYGFAHLIINEQIGIRLKSQAAERSDRLLAFVGRQAERMRLLSTSAALGDMLKSYSAGALNDEQFASRAGHIIDDIRRSFKSTDAHAATEGGQLLAVHLVNAAGETICVTGKSVLEEPVVNLPEYRTGQERFVLGFPSIHQTATRSILAAPITIDGGDRFVVVAELESNPMLTMVTGHANLGQTGEVVVVRVRDGRMELMDPTQDRALRDRDPSSWPLLSEHLGRGLQYGRTQDRSGRDVLAVLRPLGYEDWFLIAKMDVAEAFEPLGRLRWMSFGLAAGTLAAGLVLSYAFSYRITRPLIELARFAADEVRRRPHLELIAEPDLSVVAFRRLGWSPEQYHVWSDRLLLTGFAFVVPTTYGGETVTRLAVVNPRTTEADISSILDTMA